MSRLTYTRKVCKMLKNRKRSDILVKLVGLCRYRDIKIVYIVVKGGVIIGV